MIRRLVDGGPSRASEWAQLDQEDQIVSTCLTTLPAFGRQALESKRVRLDFRRRLKDCLSVPVITPGRRVSASTFFRDIARVSTYFLDSRWFGALLI